ncbi:MAG: ABC transporter ATP-binding protein [Tepidamorphaceae bacterium]|nr:ABC transporter ATP-binding protein [Rhodobiaceae bacterium]MCC0048562.1 ABC transporter ATP-binding protein [Rhodobiaceae bacterium]
MTDPVLEVTNLSKSFGALAACKNVSLDLMPGEIHALIGPNGAGKTTLVKTIAGEIAHDAGHIRFDGELISHLDAAGRARLGLARTFQISSLAMEMSALKNVMLAVMAVSGEVFRFFRHAGSDDALLGPARACLEEVGLQNRAHTRVAELSHGERRQLEIAIALAMKPKAFLMDEPMAGMGPEGLARLSGLLRDLKETAPVLLIEHDMDVVFSLADRISVLVYGEVIATGTVEEIRANPDVQGAYLGDAA